MNNEILEYADKYSHDIWEKLMLKIKTTEGYSIGCNDVSDIVLNAIINACNWQKKQDEEWLNGELMKAHLNGVAAGDTITKETLRTEYEKGRYDMREEMMKNSTDAYIHRNRYTKTNVLHLDVTCDAVQGFKDNDKLKVIFIKND